MVAFAYLVAASAIVTGALTSCCRLRLDADDGCGWLALGGIVSLNYGGVAACCAIGGSRRIDMVARRLGAGIQCHPLGRGLQTAIGGLAASAQVSSPRRGAAAVAAE